MRVKSASTLRRFSGVSIVTAVALAGAISGCFAIFSLDGYGPPGDIVDGGSDVLTIGDTAMGKESAFVGHRIFITDATYRGDLGGIDGGDDKCQAVAADAGLPGTYVAWLSDPSHDAIDRLVRTAGPVRLSTGLLVAETVGELATTGPRTPIINDERGKPYVTGDCDGGLVVWTATAADGGKQGPVGPGNTGDCVSWSRIGPTTTGSAGAVGGPGTTWSSGCVRTCDMLAALLCVER